ncbi:MAG: hypothetical protein GY896_13405 [Gammaproteobacteria bacterium]|nr:hypothetical protein [Gammaproteobacteria bacterium]
MNPIQMVSLLFFLSNSGDFKNLLSVFCYLKKLCISHPWTKPGAGSDLAKHEKTQLGFCVFSYFSITCVTENWLHFPAPQESLHIAEAP